MVDVLFGNYYPQSELPHPWPVSNTQLPTNVGDPVYEPPYQYNFRLGLKPSRNIVWEGSAPQLSRPQGNTGWILQSTTNLADGTSWSDLSVTQTIVGTTYQVTLPLTSASQSFYPLRRSQ